MLEKNSIRDQFNRVGDTFVQSSIKPRFMGSMVAFSLMTLPFSQSASAAICATPSIMCAMGLTLKKISHLGLKH